MKSNSVPGILKATLVILLGTASFVFGYILGQSQSQPSGELQGKGNKHTLVAQEKSLQKTPLPIPTLPIDAQKESERKCLQSLEEDKQRFQQAQDDQSGSALVEEYIRVADFYAQTRQWDRFAKTTAEALDCELIVDRIKRGINSPSEQSLYAHFFLSRMDRWMQLDGDAFVSILKSSHLTLEKKNYWIDYFRDVITKEYPYRNP